jgi:hypothetical protein
MWWPVAGGEGIAKATVADLDQGRYASSWLTVMAQAGSLGVGCRALLEGPEARSGLGRGRPPKPTPEPGEQPDSKRPRKGA